MLPTFIVAGAGKCGTSWLHVCMDEHPQVFVPPQKELRFFSHNFERGLDWYEGFFDTAPPGSIAGELSPCYLGHPLAPTRIATTCPETVVLFLLRDPVERALSHYYMYLRNGAVSDQVDAELKPGTVFLEDGRYGQHIQRFEDAIGAGRLQLFFYDDLKSRPRDFLSTIWSALNVDPSFEPSILNRAFHERKPLSRSPRLTRMRIRAQAALMRRSDRIRAAVDIVRRRGWMRPVYDLLSGRPYPRPSPAKISELTAYYRPDVEQIAHRTGRDLSSWLEPRK